MAGQIEQNRVWVGLCAKRNVFSFGMDVKWSGFHYDEADVGLKTWKTSAGIVRGIISKVRLRQCVTQSPPSGQVNTFPTQTIHVEFLLTFKTLK